MQTTVSRPGKTGRSGSRHIARSISHGRSRNADRSPARPGRPSIVTVFRGADGRMYHGWCGQTLLYQGRRARLELDYYCPHCLEHVSVPECTLPHITVGTSRAESR